MEEDEAEKCALFCLAQFPLLRADDASTLHQVHQYLTKSLTHGPKSTKDDPAIPKISRVYVRRTVRITCLHVAECIISSAVVSKHLHLVVNAECTRKHALWLY